MARSKDIKIRLSQSFIGKEEIKCYESLRSRLPWYG